MKKSKRSWVRSSRATVRLIAAGACLLTLHWTHSIIQWADDPVRERTQTPKLVKRVLFTPRAEAEDRQSGNKKRADARSLKSYEDLVYARVDGQDLKLDLFVPRASTNPPLIVWVHGGGWRAGSKKNPKLFKLTESGYALASISYRFTDKAIFPAQIHDCKGAIRWLRANAENYGVDAEWIGVAGSSAGGHLALLMGTSGGVADLEGDIGGNLQQSSSVQAVIDYYGPSDFVLRGKTQPERAYTEKSGSLALLGGKQTGKLKPEVERFGSPVTYISKDDPPLLIFHGDKDQTVLLDQSQHLDRLYREAGLRSELIVLAGAGHGGKDFFIGDHFDKAREFFDAHRPRE